MVGDIREVGLTGRIQTHEIQGGQENDVLTLLLQVEGEHVRGHDLSLGQDFFLLDRTEMLAGEGTQERKYSCEHLARLVGILLRGIKLRDVLGIFHLKRTDSVGSALGVSVCVIVGDLDQGVGRSGHGGQDYDLALTVIDKAGDALHPVCGAH